MRGSTREINGGCGEEGGVGNERKRERKGRNRSAVRRKEMRVEERRNQRHRGHDANPLGSLETPASVTVGALWLSSGCVEPQKRKNNGGET